MDGKIQISPKEPTNPYLLFNLRKSEICRAQAMAEHSLTEGRTTLLNAYSPDSDVLIINLTA